jgi:hypothetical protein
LKTWSVSDLTTRIEAIYDENVTEPRLQAFFERRPGWERFPSLDPHSPPSFIYLYPKST